MTTKAKLLAAKAKVKAANEAYYELNQMLYNAEREATSEAVEAAIQANRAREAAYTKFRKDHAASYRELASLSELASEAQTELNELNLNCDHLDENKRLAIKAQKEKYSGDFLVCSVCNSRWELAY